MNSITDISCYYIALIRSVSMVHQNNHWRTKGSNFYSNHLLFERIYKSAAEDADLAAEKLIGLFDDDVLDLHMQAQMIGKTLEHFSHGDPIQTSLEAEKKFLDYSQKFYNILNEDDGKLSLGLDDMLMSIASNREGAVYLLQQSLKNERKNTKASFRIAALNQIKTAGQSEKALLLQKKINDNLIVNLGNRNWGQVGFNYIYVYDNNDTMLATYDLVIPTNSPPFKDKSSYPQGVNQFKQEIMNIVSKIAQFVGVNQLTQEVKINGQ